MALVRSALAFRQLRNALDSKGRLSADWLELAFVCSYVVRRSWGLTHANSPK